MRPHHNVTFPPVSERRFAFARALLRFSLTLVSIIGFILTFSSALASAGITHEFSTSFTSNLGDPQNIAVDSEGDLYVMGIGENAVEKLAPSGSPVAFSATGEPGKSYIQGNKLTGWPAESFNFGGTSEAEIAVDNSPGVTQGYIYVTTYNPTNRVEVFDKSGTYQGEINPESATPQSGGQPCGVAVNPSNHDIYVSYYSGHVDKYTPRDSNPLDDTFDGQFENVGSPCVIAVDSTGAAYVNQWSAGPLVKYPASQLNQENPAGTLVDSSATAVTVDPKTDDVYIDDGSQIAAFNSSQESVGPPFGSANLAGSLGLTIDGSGDVYATNATGTIAAFGPSVIVPDATTGPVSSPGSTFGTLTGNVAPLDGGEVTSCYFEYGTDQSYGSGELECEPATPYAGESEVSAKLSGLLPEATYHYRLVVGNTNGTNFGRDRTFTPHRVIGLTTEAPTHISSTGVQLNGSLIGGGQETHYFFEWGTDLGYGHTTAVPPGVYAGAPSGPNPTPLTFVLGSLDPDTHYHYRIVASNSEGTSYGEDEEFETPTSSPLISESAEKVRTDIATLRAVINPGGLDTKYHFEWGKDISGSETYETVVPSQDVDIGAGTEGISEGTLLTGLIPGTTYHFRVVAENQLGTVTGPEVVFKTFGTGSSSDSCTNAHTRQQTSAAQLPDCRAYELVSASNTGGNDVESNLVPGQDPFDGYPEAENPSRVLYAVHDGTIPGVSGDPTNDGPDPYLATRGANGWTTSYVGIPENGTPSIAPFASTLLEANPRLDTFAFGGEDICSPCFSDQSSGLPIRLPDGRLVQGMAGPIEVPLATADGYIAKHLSTNGSHFIFGSVSKFAEGGNSGGVVSIYDRDVNTGETHVVSENPEGEPLPCLQSAGEGDCHSPGDTNGIAELDVSADGSRIIVAQKVATDAKGNVYWHLYMDIRDSSKTIDLTPGAAHGVLFDGMTEDGSRVFFTTREALATTSNQDTDSSSDIYQAEVSEGGVMALTRISIGDGGAAGNTDNCDPAENSNGPHWNAIGAVANCDAVAIAGGGGVALAGGSIYFLSPELLGGPSNGIQNAPNLYLARPGFPPHFVTSLETNNPVVIDAVSHAGTFSYGDFQVTPKGNFAVFTSTLPLVAGVHNAGTPQVYRYDADTDTLNCVSCNPTGATDEGEGSLSRLGLGLTTDGRVFFNSTEALAARDENESTDVYEWENGTVALISTGTSPTASRLLSASADGTDTYFFTRDNLVPQDENRDHIKIYDAREGGGYPYVPIQPQCASSDECHGPGSVAPSPPNIATIAGTPTAIVAGKKKMNHHRKKTRHHHKRRNMRTTAQNPGGLW